MQDTIGVFLDQIACERGQRINITEWIAMLAYDIMGVVSFGKDFGSLRAAKEVHAIKQLRDTMRSLGLLFSVPWVINFLSNMPGLGGAMGPFGAYCKRLVSEKRKMLMEKKVVETTPADVMSWLIQAFEEGGPSGAPTLAALHADGRALVIAGSDTTYGALTNALFHLASNPAIYAKLQAEVDSVCPDGEASFSHEKVKNLPLLDGVINETLRLKPPVPNGTPRLTPPEGLQIDDDLYIPGNVHVIMPPWVMHRDERYFEKPLEFIPERWILGGEKAGMIKDRNAFFPFQIGMFHCAGKQLAYWEMRSVLARLALRYNIRFASAQDGKDYESKLFNTVTLSPPPLGMCFRPRKEAKA
ncbi:Tryprostatin B 6-hydroxylase [Lasiodiplodia hormozganensis]|uniref:Tryprostatin B 6-hydroxylase n=1 Tax=Lasiodiplodia hormozganensis TaxID=869390 RepID=A0AA39T0A4_9PEZI|nr:Tryprostatin B 6-hydroxylase [Lasiodiplodia hormozganensis]